MTIEKELLQRCDSKCELCSSDSNLTIYEVPPVTDPSTDNSIMICDVCLKQISKPEDIDATHWHCLKDSMWSQIPVVQVMAWRILKHLSTETWAQDLLDMLYLDEETQHWADAVTADASDASSSPTLDSNGTPLANGDTVSLIKDLDVKGAGFTTKRGTAVRNISLTSNPEQIEGRVNGVRIVLLTRFLKKANQ